MLKDSLFIELAKENRDSFRDAEISHAAVDMERVQIVL